MSDPDEPVIQRIEPKRFTVQLPDLDYRSLLEPGRHGEVAMIIMRSPGWVLLQAKTHYPPGIFRLPTGTMRADESAAEAMQRELHEEANLIPGRWRHLGRLEYDITGGRQGFFTELFLIENPQGQLHPNDKKEGINAWREAMISELPHIAAELRQLEPPWKGWGFFRSLLHLLVGQLLEPVP